MQLAVVVFGWFADSIPTLVGFLRAIRFPPTPKNWNPFIFLVHSFWSLVVCTKPAWLPQVWLPMCTAAAFTQRRLENPVGWYLALKKLQIIIIIKVWLEEGWGGEKPQSHSIGQMRSSTEHFLCDSTPLLKIVIYSVVSIRSRAVSHDRNEPINQPYTCT